jgi:hypothetical protein
MSTVRGVVSLVSESLEKEGQGSGKEGGTYCLGLLGRTF